MKDPAAQFDGPPEGAGVAPVVKNYTTQEGLLLFERFLARELAAEREFVLQVNRLLHRVWLQRWQRYGLPFLELRGDCFALLGEWREEGRLRVEPLPHLAQRLMKQCGRQQLRDRYSDEKRLVSVDEGWDEPESDSEDHGLAGRRRGLLAALAGSSGSPSAEEALAQKELVAWLFAAREELSPAERETFDAERRVLDGAASSLNEALGIGESAAWQRRRRMRLSLAVLAKRDGLDEVVAMSRGGRAVRRDRKEDGR